MSVVSITHPLDWGRHYRLVFHYVPDKRALSGMVLGPVGSTGEVERHLVTLISLNVAGKIHTLSYTPGQAPSFSTLLTPADAGEFTLDVRMGGSSAREGELFGHYRVAAGTVLVGEVLQMLTVFETRMLGNEKLYRWLPYPRHRLSATYLKTDLHTHSSGQISAGGLVDIAVAHHIPYPTRLLSILGIAYDPSAVVEAKRFFFPPTDAGEIGRMPEVEDAVPIDSLCDEGRARLLAALSIPADKQTTFGDLEVTVYRFRTPISKHPAAAYDLLHVTALEYARHGVTYAELTATSTSLLLPDYMEMVHQALPKIEAETGVRLRFLVGLPRNLPAAMLVREVDKLMLMGASPYLVGVDFMGFEDNKIEEMEPHILRIAAWAAEHDSEFTLRIHAGENRKNLSNVKESLRIAQKCRMRVRIGHAAHGLDAEAVEIAEALAREKLVVIEFNPDSNLALNNIDTAEELEITTCITRDIPFVICSDGGGLYQTDVRQLEAAASFAGVGPNHVPTLMQHEKDHMAREDARFARKSAALAQDFLPRVREAFTAMPPLSLPPRPQESTEAFERHLSAHGIAFKADEVARATAGKKPLLILGATGARYWARISQSHQQQIAQLVSGLVGALEPAHSYFMVGRPKPEGLTLHLSAAVQTHNSGYAEDKHFSLVSATVQADQTPLSFTPGITHVLPLAGGLFTVPLQLVQHVAAAGGVLVCIGGGTFVRDAILVAHQRGVPLALMKGPEGASSDKSVMMDPSRQFTDLEGLLEIIRRHEPQMLR